MFCTKCGEKIEEGQKFCSSCGHRVIETINNDSKVQYEVGNDQFQKSQKYQNQGTKNSLDEHPIYALLLQDIGIGLWAALIIFNRSNDIRRQIWLSQNKGIVFVIGVVLIIIANFLFKEHKEKYGLHGIGYSGYLTNLICLGAALIFMCILGIKLLFNI